MDFLFDKLCHGRCFRRLNVLDEGVREALEIVIDTSILRALDRLVAWRGHPEAIRVDNGTEYTSQVCKDSCQVDRVTPDLIQPRKTNQNAYSERFNRAYRQEVLNAYVFGSLSPVRDITRKWIKQYNEERLHSSLGEIPPSMVRRPVENAENSSFELSRCWGSLHLHPAAAFDLFQRSNNLCLLETRFTHFPFSFSVSLCWRPQIPPGAILW